MSSERKPTRATETWSGEEPSAFAFLYVDASKEAQTLVKDLLREGPLATYELSEASTLEQALVKLAHTDFDLVLLELDLPDVQGLDGLRLLRQEAPATPVIIVSDLADEDLMAAAARLGAHEFLEKERLDPHTLGHTLQYIAHRKRFEATLRASEERYRTLIDNVRVGVYRNTGGERGCFLQANPAIALMFGYESVEEFMQVPVADLYQDPGDRILFINELQREGFVEHRELLLRKKDGTPIWGSCTARAVRDEYGRIKWMDGIIEDITEVKRTNLALRASERKYRQLVDTLAEGIWVIDHDAITTFVNPRMAEMLGYTEEEMMGRHLFDFMDEAGVEQCKQNLARRKEGIAEDHDFELLSKAGERRHMQMSTSPILDDRGQYTGAIASVRDVTERRDQHQLLTTQSLILENLAEGVNVTDHDGYILFTNPSFDAMFGYGPGELIGQHASCLDDMPKEESRAFFRELVDALEAEGSWEGDFRNRRKDGSPFCTRGRMKLLQIEGESCRVSIQEDVTERRQVEEAIRLSEERYRNLYDNIPLMYFTLGTQGKVLSVNRYAVEHLGYADRELVGAPVLNIFHEDDREAVATNLDRCLARPGSVSNWVFRKICKDGRTIWVEEAVRAIPSPDGGLVVLVACEDITERKHLEEETLKLAARLLEVQEKERKDISASLHDNLGQILTLARMEVASALKKEGVPHDTLDSAVRRIDEALASVRSLALTLRPPLLDDLGLVAAMDMLVDEFNAGGLVEVHLLVEGDTSRIATGVQTDLYRILQEALTNTVKHAGAKEVHVLLHAKADRGCRLEICDDGRGIAPAAAEASEGIGLLGIRERAHRCGGQLEIDTKPGEGTAIRVTIPPPPKQEASW